MDLNSTHICRATMLCCGLRIQMIFDEWKNNIVGKFMLRNFWAVLGEKERTKGSETFPT